MEEKNFYENNLLNKIYTDMIKKFKKPSFRK